MNNMIIEKALNKLGNMLRNIYIKINKNDKSRWRCFGIITFIVWLIVYHLYIDTGKIAQIRSFEVWIKFAFLSGIIVFSFSTILSNIIPTIIRKAIFFIDNILKQPHEHQLKKDEMEEFIKARTE